MSSQLNGAQTHLHLMYASEQIGASFSPGTDRVGPTGIKARRNTRSALELIYDRFVNTGLSNWLPFTWPLMNRFLGPRAPGPAFASPYDLDAGLRITRYGTLPSSDRRFPYPYGIGAVSGFMPMLDQYSLSWAWGKTAYGPGISTPIQVPWQVTYPNLSKVTG